MKLLASDYDGTLNRNGTISKEDIEAIQMWQECGNLFGLITGRGYKSAAHEMNYYGIKYDFLICNNGSSIFDNNNKCIASITGNNTILKTLITLIIEHNGDRAAISGGKSRACVVLDEARDNSTNCPDENWIIFEDIDKLDFPFTQVDTNALTDDNAALLARRINKILGKFVYAHQNGTNVDTTPVGVNKPTGIHSLVKHLNISSNNVFVVGDNLNDLEMIKEFDGFAMTSGNPVVIKQARRAYDTIFELVKDII